MTTTWLRRLRGTLGCVVLGASPCFGQAAPPAPTPADDSPSIKVGALLFADYTVTQSPKVTDADGNTVTLSSFNITRAYINVFGKISRSIAFRVTPDIVRETGAGSALNGSYTFRLKFAFAQWNLDSKPTPGTWVRFGLQPMPWTELMDGIYRYRIQGPVFEDREGFVLSSDAGAAVHSALPGEYGDVQAGFYNGEGYMRAETNDQKAFIVRGSLRPLPNSGSLQGLRAHVYYAHDAYVKDAERRRTIVSATYEHPHVHAGFDWLSAADQISAVRLSTDARGWTAWATPRMSNGWEGLIRFDDLEPDTRLDARKKRTVGGVAYWFPPRQNITTALMFDVEQVKYDRFAPARVTERRFAVHAMVSF